MNIFKYFYKKPNQPIKGQRWTLKNETPWPVKDAHTVLIRDIKDGWVRYELGILFPDERLRMDMFLKCYKLY